MRVEVQIIPTSNHRSDTEMTINYQSLLSSAIYKLLSRSSSDFATNVHDRTDIKMFVFSNLYIPQFRRRQDKITGHPDKMWSFMVSSPNNNFIYHLSNGGFSNQIFILGNVNFKVVNITQIPDSVFQAKTVIQTLSPITISKPGEKYPQYIHPHNKEFGDYLKKNIKRKFELLYNTPAPDEFDIHVSSVKEKLITLKANTPHETRIKGYNITATITGDPRLIKVGWECGLGNHNSQGFGLFKTMEY